MGGWSVGCENRAAFRMKRLQSPHRFIFLRNTAALASSTPTRRANLPQINADDYWLRHVPLLLNTSAPFSKRRARPFHYAAGRVVRRSDGKGGRCRCEVESRSRQAGSGT